MSLWWVRKEQLDPHQIKLVERLPLNESFLVLGPPGSGKTNVLLRRAQFVRGQNMPNVLVLTFTRPLTEFLKTGCFDDQEREIFPQDCVTTLESWLRSLYFQHEKELPPETGNLIQRKRELATGALEFRAQNRIPPYDALFVDEAQDLLPEEVKIIKQWADVLFFVGDDRQRIYGNTEGLKSVRQVIPTSHEKVLPFHYRMAHEICEVADRILVASGEDTLSSKEHYKGPLPARATRQPRRQSRDQQLESAIKHLNEQIRVYADLIKQGDRLGVIVARKEDRVAVFDALEEDEHLAGKSKIIRARDDRDDDYDPSFDPDTPICILTVQGCKGLEFRAVHWLFCDELRSYHNEEHYYTVVTRAKTSIDVYYTHTLPQVLARAFPAAGVTPW